jgi:hypothetical protein
MDERKSSPWKLQTDSALLVCGPLAGELFLSKAGAQLGITAWHGRPVTHRLPVLHTGFADRDQKPLRIADCYVRGDDLVATFDKTGTDRLAPQYYWRAALDSVRSIVRIELILSVQSDLLDSQPQSTVVSFAPAGRWFIRPDLRNGRWLECSSDFKLQRQRSDSPEQLCVFRDEENGLSYVQMVHPSDFVSLHVEMIIANRYKKIDALLFPEHLEKGVIRRGRICGWFMPTENDLETAVELAREFVNEPPPLTA